MIDIALTFLRDQINQYIQNKTGDGADKLVLVNLVGPDGGTDHLPSNSLLMTLVRLEEDKIAKSAPPYIEKIDENFFSYQPEINLNLYLLFSAHFGGQSDQYVESLKLLSHVIGFFQINPFFDQSNTTSLNQGIDKVAFELISPSFEVDNQMWGMLGAKYMPSVMYKMRLLTIKSDDIQNRISRIEKINIG